MAAAHDWRRLCCLLPYLVQFAKGALGPAEIEICADYRTRGKTTPEDCGKRWVVTNAVRVRDFWEIHELRLFWDANCEHRLVGKPIGTAVAPTMQGHVPARAFDNNLQTRWTADCQPLLFGCLPYTTYVGLDISGKIPLNFNPLSSFAQVRGLRIFQSPNMTRHASSIQVRVWNGVHGQTDPLDNFLLVETFDSLGGGAWQRRPTLRYGLWRIWNLDSTTSGWHVAELLFFTDHFCQNRHYGMPICGRGVPGSDDLLLGEQGLGVPLREFQVGVFWPDGCTWNKECDAYSPDKAFDGSQRMGYRFPEALPTYWKAPCQYWKGCEPMQAWVGLDFNDDPKMIQCIAIYQPGYWEQPVSGRRPHYTGSVVLQGYNGYKWMNMRYFSGLGHGGWNTTAPKPMHAWHLANYDKVDGPWIIFELAFYQNAECKAIGRGAAWPDELRGEGVDSNPVLRTAEARAQCRKMIGSCFRNAFDKIVTSAWQSTCHPCWQHKAWLGMKFRRHTDVRCFRVLQSEDTYHVSPTIDLRYWNGDEWKSARVFSGFSGGNWNFRPLQHRMALRVVALAEINLPWAVDSLTFYNDSACLSELRHDLVASGSEAGYPVSYAFDASEETEWVASCNVKSTAGTGCGAGVAWLGMESRSQTLEVKCFSIKQHRSADRQAREIALEGWSGLEWAAISDRDIFPDSAWDSHVFSDIGGGSWQTLPGIRASKWRVRGEPAAGALGFGVAELRLYRSPECDGQWLTPVRPNIMPICSAFRTAREVSDLTGYSEHMRSMGAFSDASCDKAFDGDLGTFWAEVGSGVNWVGLDFTQPTDIKCVQMTQAGVRQLQAVSAEVQAWDGLQWAVHYVSPSGRDFSSQLIMSLTGCRITGWRMWPSAIRSLWRLENADKIEAWDVAELEFYLLADCSGMPMRGQFAIGSASSAAWGVPDGGHMVPSLAFDGDLGTYWKADCRGSTCAPGEAWLGLDLNSSTEVRCFRIVQSGRRHRQASTVTLSTLMGTAWQPEVTYRGLGGETWNTRPALPDTLWRLALAEQHEPCSAWTHSRAWGISELEMFEDDACSVPVPGPLDGATPIASGTRLPEVLEEGPSPFTPARAFDGDTHTFWAADCGAGRDEPIAYCAHGLEWIGLDFGTPKEIRCLRVFQSLLTEKECCDPASEMHLERWNGTAWVVAVWQHIQMGAPPIQIRAFFTSSPRCSTDILNPAVARWETRARRTSEQCILPLSTAVESLTDPTCGKHSACHAADFTGLCCPADGSRSRCCCDFLMHDVIFEDELERDVALYREETKLPYVGFEFVVIRSVVVLPFFGLLLALLFYVAISIPKQSSPGIRYRVWCAICEPLQRWLETDTLIALSANFFCGTRPGETIAKKAIRASAWFLLGFVLGGPGFCLFLAYVISELAVLVTLFLSTIIYRARSPYKVSEAEDMRRMMLVLNGGNAVAEASEAPQRSTTLGTLAHVLQKTLASIVMGIVCFVKFIFDFVLIRYSMMALKVINTDLNLQQILVNVPGYVVAEQGYLKLPLGAKLNLKPMIDVIHDVATCVEQIFQSAYTFFFDGVPRCEGPLLLFSGIWLVLVSLVLMRWMNCDFFGLFAAVVQCVTTTRPTCQRAVGLLLVVVVQSACFVFLQCVMLLFARSFLISDPLGLSNTDWVCPYSGEEMSLILGRFFAWVSIAGALFVTFLYASGHFLGLPRFSKAFGKQVGMDLSGLDSRITARNTSFIRCDTFLSVLPTTCGIWVDGWNVQGFLIKERAQTYSDQMGVPVMCPHCQTAHVPYWMIMRATSMEISLAYHLLPFGPLVGKAAEYLNNPPLLYCGSQLKCYNLAQNVEQALEGLPRSRRKSSWSRIISCYSRLLIACCRDWLVPLLVRIASLALYVLIVVLTCCIDVGNVNELAKTCFQASMILSIARAALGFVVPALLRICSLAILACSRSDTHKRAKSSGMPSFRERLPVIGQTAVGVTIGISLARYFLRNVSWLHATDRFAFCGALAGASASVLIVALAWAILGSSPILYALFVISKSLALGALVPYLVSQDMEEGLPLVTGIATVAFFVPVSGATFRASRSGSLLRPLLRSWRAMPGPLGTVFGVYVGSLPSSAIIDSFGLSAGLGIVAAVAIISGIGGAIGVDSVMHRTSEPWAFAIGSVAALILAGALHWTLGVIVGVILGLFAGSVVEYRLVLHVKAKSFAVASFGSMNAISSSSSKGGTSLQDEAAGAHIVAGSTLPPDAVFNEADYPNELLQESTNDFTGQAPVQLDADLEGSTAQLASDDHGHPRRRPTSPKKYSLEPLDQSQAPGGPQRPSSATRSPAQPSPPSGEPAQLSSAASRELARPSSAVRVERPSSASRLPSQSSPSPAAGGIRQRPSSAGRVTSLTTASLEQQLHMPQVPTRSLQRPSSKFGGHTPVSQGHSRPSSGSRCSVQTPQPLEESASLSDALSRVLSRPSSASRVLQRPSSAIRPPVDPSPPMGEPTQLTDSGRRNPQRPSSASRPPVQPTTPLGEPAQLSLAASRSQQRPRSASRPMQLHGAEPLEHQADRYAQSPRELS